MWLRLRSATGERLEIERSRNRLELRGNEFECDFGSAQPPGKCGQIGESHIDFMHVRRVNRRIRQIRNNEEEF